MANDFTMSVGQAHELEMAMNRVGGWDAALVKQLSTGDHLAWVRNVLKGVWEAKESNHILDLDTDPFLPEGWGVEEHQKGGQFEWDPAKVEFYLSKSQQGGKTIEEGNKLRKELADSQVLNANMLDYLLRNPTLIPDAWKVDGEGNTRFIYFWGTIYRGPDGRLYVRSLYFYGGHWQAHYGYLGISWGGHDPAARFAS